MPVQQATFPPHALRRPGLIAAAAAAALACPAWAQEGPRGWAVQPSVSLQQTVTNNARLEQDGRSDAITQVTPGVRVSGRSGRVQGALDYQLDLIQYARESDRSTTHNRLSADAGAELVDQHLFLDASASISQQTISAFGRQNAGTGLVDSNSTEVATATVSPTFKARLAGLVDVGARATWTTSRAEDSTAGDYTDWDASVDLGARHGLFGWGLAGSRSSSRFQDGGRYITDIGVATLSVFPTSRFSLFVRGGRERTDALGTGTRYSSSSGGGLTWLPTPRTRLTLETDERYFGRSHSVSVSHRFRRVALTYSDTRGVTGDNADALGPLRALYGQIYAACMQQFGNAALCTQVSRLALGLDPTVPLTFLNSAPSLQRAQALSLGFSGVRNSASLVVTSTENRRLGEQQYIGGDLALVPSVRQLALTLGGVHQMTRQTSLGLSASLLKTLDEESQPGTEQRRLELSMTSTLGPRTQGTLAVRRVWFDSETSPYQESAIVGTLNYRF
ncbi:TIGR03016 family PEP-CTERM system-associated outer membrane protein [Rubrivivax sp. JA1024]|nr:TIGR03016 family PEP-CTERM system-associated outer membrane protein [Rubrivivax sp. JA1024]